MLDFYNNSILLYILENVNVSEMNTYVIPLHKYRVVKNKF